MRSSSWALNASSPSWTTFSASDIATSPSVACERDPTEVGREALAQLELQHLAGGVARDRLDQLEPGREFEAGEPRLGESSQVVEGQLGLCDDDGGDRLPPSLV